MIGLYVGTPILTGSLICLMLGIWAAVLAITGLLFFVFSKDEPPAHHGGIGETVERDVALQRIAASHQNNRSNR